ncbi:hypothetical protein MHLP_00350 [Candidatus Mycoplasma haematolamae str. Purdue]|uniref:Uncharacterized protein n=1 Tax=Mycoplasma haematolamae (strain Purdue) TaxID=1212765 RepID=I7B8T8_MYCHA|nr:hypothetical protein MHLP_00350 [Candidatus Mycoplasma haematolamae str. Purdue]
MFAYSVTLSLVKDSSPGWSVNIPVRSVQVVPVFLTGFKWSRVKCWAPPGSFSQTPWVLKPSTGNSPKTIQVAFSLEEQNFLPTW